MAVHREIKKKYGLAKETWNYESETPKKQKFKNMTYIEKSNVSGIIRREGGKLSYKRKDIMKRWTEDLGELFVDEDSSGRFGDEILVDEETDPYSLACELENAKM